MASQSIEPSTTTAVELSLPVGLPYQLIYRMQRSTPYATRERDDVQFHYVCGLGQLLPLLGTLRRTTDMLEMLRSTIRVAVGRRFYCVLRGRQLLHRGWANVAKCRHYKVGAGEVVIGPIWSAPEARGLGLAAYATQQAINRLIGEGLSVFYIDTASDNLACQAMIARCGFGQAMGCMPRKPE